jgi:hypothetical protein
MARRLRTMLPQGWFAAPPATGQAETAPVLNAVLLGLGAVLSAAYGLIQYVGLQGRAATATDSNLDLIAADFFGTGGLARAGTETDAAYRTRIRAALFPALGTRAAVIEAITLASGSAPLAVIEPMDATDTKGRGSAASPASGGGYGYGASGLRYGSMSLPDEMFVAVNAGSASKVTVSSAVNRARPGGVAVWLSFTS